MPKSQRSLGQVLHTQVLFGFLHGVQCYQNVSTTKVASVCTARQTQINAIEFNPHLFLRQCLQEGLFILKTGRKFFTCSSLKT